VRARCGLELAEIFRQIGPAYRRSHAGSLSRAQLRVMSAIERCRTAALGGHVERCDACAHQRITYNSCRDRHCPKCQSLVRAQWLDERRAELLPVEYFHVVFTVPAEIAAIAYQNKAVLYELLFRATAETLRTIAADPRHLGAEIGFIALLHTWGQQLLHHPHLHCVVPGGGIGVQGERWIACRPGFFLPVRVLSRLFRRLFLEQLRGAFERHELQFFNALAALKDANAFARYLAPLARTEWVVYSKPPFGGPEHVLEYLGRYTHRVAIANHRLLEFAEGRVAFQWKDYRHAARRKVMRLEAQEFVRRFLLHVLPRGLQRIRHYGLLANRSRALKLAHARQLLQVPAPPQRPRHRPTTGSAMSSSPACRCACARSAGAARWCASNPSPQARNPVLRHAPPREPPASPLAGAPRPHDSRRDGPASRALSNRAATHSGPCAGGPLHALASEPSRGRKTRSPRRARARSVRGGAHERASNAHRSDSIPIDASARLAV